MALMSGRGMILVVVLAGCLAVVVACGGKPTGERVAESLMEKAMERGGVKDADLDLKKGKFRYKTEEGEGEISYDEGEWPGDLPEGVPQFTMAKVKGVTRSDRNGKKGWNIIVEEVEDGAVEKYAEQLKDNGWTLMSQMNNAQGSLVQASKGDLILMGMINTEERGGGISISTH
jgi:hypothetical protein